MSSVHVAKNGGITMGESRQKQATGPESARGRRMSHKCKRAAGRAIRVGLLGLGGRGRNNWGSAKESSSR